jgi:hypothetical protein
MFRLANVLCCVCRRVCSGRVTAVKAGQVGQTLRCALSHTKTERNNLTCNPLDKMTNAFYSAYVLFVLA